MLFEGFPAACPPNDARDTDDDVAYRLVRSSRTEVLEDDFRSYYEQGKAAEDHCQGRGLSIFTTLEGVKEHKAKVKGMKNKRIARGTLKAGMGKLKHTPATVSNHHTFWKAADAPHGITELFELL